MQSKDKAGVNLIKLLQSLAIVAIVFRHQNNGHTGKLHLEKFYYIGPSANGGHFGRRRSCVKR